MSGYVDQINDQYSQGNLSATLLAALQRAGKNLAHLTRDDTAPFDEFHVGGRRATRELAQLAGLGEGVRVLDLGCGVGGPARTLAAEFGCQVVGLDIVSEYCQAAAVLTVSLGLADQARFCQGSALELPFVAGCFDVVWVQHVLMNVADKIGLLGQIRRVLCSTGRLAFHTICAGARGPVLFPVPWADGPDVSFLTSAGELRRALTGAGFRELVWRDISTSQLEWLGRALARRAAWPQNDPPTLVIDLVMGLDAGEKLANLELNLRQGRIEFVQAVLEATPSTTDHSATRAPSSTTR